MVSHPDSVRTRDGLTLSLRHWPAIDREATRGIVCLVHGLGEHISRYERLATTLNGWGWSVVGYDQRAHGHSSGKRGVLHEQDDLLHDLALVLDTLPTKVADQKLVLLGHSLGGLVVARLVAALSEPHENSPWQRPVDLCVLSSPALALHLSFVQKMLITTLGTIAPHLALRNGLDPEWLCTDAEVVKRYRSDPLVHARISGRLATFMLEAAKIVHLRAASWRTPTLLLYSGADRCVNPEGSARFATSAPQSLVELHAFDTLNHEILNEPVDAGVYSALNAWLQKFGSSAVNDTNFSIDKMGLPKYE